MKNIWITSLSDEPALIKEVGAVLQRYGMRGQAHVWQDNLEKHYPQICLEQLQTQSPDAWLILGRESELQQASVRYGISLISASLACQSRPPALFFLSPRKLSEQQALPDLCQQLSATMLSLDATNWAAKIVATLARPSTASDSPVRLRVWGNEQIGQWLELSPETQAWQGMIFGVSGQIGTKPAAVSFQAVGPRGGLPQKTTLEFAQQGLEIQASERNFSAWALRNPIALGNSYFCRIDGHPEQILFMPYSDAEQADATIVELV